VVEGGFEKTTPRWQLDRAYYTRWDTYSGDSALFIGLRDGDPDELMSYASAGQTVRLPSRVDSATLKYAARPNGEELDKRLVRVYDSEGQLIALDGLFLSPSGEWEEHEEDLTSELQAQAGSEIQLFFGVLNNGNGNRSFMRIDDVSLVVCPSFGAETPPTDVPGESTETPGPTAVSTSIPTSPPTGDTQCRNVLGDSGFEAADLGNWITSGGHRPERIAEPVRGGRSAVSLGVHESDSFDYSAVEQRYVTPPGIVSASLGMWMWTDSRSSGDAFVVELRNGGGGLRFPVDVGWETSAPRQWVRYDIPLDPESVSRSDRLFAAVLNRNQAEDPSGTSAVVIDDLHLEVCHFDLTLRYLPSLHRSAD
jgi:hypothetical protein